MDFNQIIYETNGGMTRYFLNASNSHIRLIKNALYMIGGGIFADLSRDLYNRVV